MEIEGDWQMIQLPMDKAPDFNKIRKANVYDNKESAVKSLTGKPVLYKGTFKLAETGDTFINMEDWGKGIIFINGKNIGRYWHTGPQQTLYIPGVWLKKGENEIVIFEQLNGKMQTEVRTTKVPVLTKLKIEQ
jgi:beta-galactosidase